jgi:type II secretory pathway component GspD/PulD (secretin)
MSGILSETQMAEIKKRIERRDGIELLSEGQVTTLTERQAQISVSEIKTIVTGISTNKNASVEPEAQPVALGPVFDVLPTVTSDGASIRLEVIPTFIEFVGYDTNTAHQPAPKVVNGETNYTTLPLPIFRVKQITHDAVVPDGRTLILGNLTTKQPNGEMRITDVTSTQTNLLFVLVTPTIIDPAGNRAKPAPRLNR